MSALNESKFIDSEKWFVFSSVMGQYSTFLAKLIPQGLFKWLLEAFIFNLFLSSKNGSA